MLEVKPSNAPNLNTEDYLNKITTSIIENLKKVAFAPSVQMTDVPRRSLGSSDEAEAEEHDRDDDENKDVRQTQARKDKMISKDNEFYDESEGEEEDGKVDAGRMRSRHRNVPSSPDLPEAPISSKREVSAEDTSRTDSVQTTTKDYISIVPEQSSFLGAQNDMAGSNQIDNTFSTTLDEE